MFDDKVNMYLHVMKSLGIAIYHETYNYCINDVLENTRTEMLQAIKTL